MGRTPGIPVLARMPVAGNEEVEEGAFGASLGDPAVCAGCDDGVELGLDVTGHEG